MKLLYRKTTPWWPRVTRAATKMEARLGIAAEMGPLPEDVPSSYKKATC